VKGRHILAIVGFLAAVTGVTAAPRVDVRGTALDGRWSTIEPAVAEFRGVPYAQPPVGARRFRLPMPWLPEPGIRVAREFPAGCFQDDYNTRWYRQVGAYFNASPERFQDPPFSEDCLYLNVWSPHPDSTARLPVLVWFHGGSNKAGWSFEPNYNGAHLAARGQILVVTVGYRLGVFGFLANPFTSGKDAATNLGLADQIEALRYVRRSIASFGGDPTRVTIAGESAGGADVLALLASPAARGLYRRAILQSGGYSLRGAPTLNDVRTAAGRLASAVRSSSLSQLQAVSAAEFFASGQRELHGQQFLPIVDGRTLNETPAMRLRRGLSVDVLVGSNANESLLYVDDNAESLDQMIEALPAEARAELGTWARSAGSVRAAQDRLGSFIDMGCSAQLTAASVRLPHHAYLYRFTRVRRGAAEAGLGAYHGAEIPYVFGTHDDWLPTDQTDRELGLHMLDAWASFVSSGQPNGKGVRAWPAYTADSPRAIEWGDTVRVIEPPDHALCARYAPLLYPVDGPRGL